MPPRLTFLVLAAAAGGALGALELGSVATLRPFTPPLFRRTALELLALWIAAGAGVGAVRLLVGRLTRRDPTPGAAFTSPLIAWAVAALIVRIDPGAKQDSGPLALAGLFAAAVLLFLQMRLDARLARVPLTGRLPVWLLLAALLLGFAESRRRGRLPPPPAAGAAARSGAAGAASTRAPSVLWISLDTVRADRLGAYGHPGGLTPNLDALAHEGVVFETLTCPMPLTAPSHTAMLSGLAPHESGVTQNGVPLRPDTAMLPPLLAREGYDTAGFVSGFPLFHRSSGFGDLFRWYDDEFDPSVPWTEGTRSTPLGGAALRIWRHFRRWRDPIERPGDRTIDRALEWLGGEATASAPFFLFVHLYDAHSEYLPHEPGVPRSRFFTAASDLERIALVADPVERAHLERLYDGEVRFVDAQVARLFAELRARGRYDDTLIVVTSDHGESLGEHAIWYEHVAPWNVEIRVPALLKLPRGEAAGTRVRGPAQTTDLAATVIRLIGASADLPGASLVGSIESGVIPPRRLFCQSSFDSSYVDHLISISDGRHKLVHRAPDWDASANRVVPSRDELFDLHADPSEARDLLAAGELPDDLDLEAWRKELAAYYQRCLAAHANAEVAEDIAEQLRKLGYGN
jgi:arylsulfatase A-like enzyme